MNLTTEILDTILVTNMADKLLHTKGLISRKQNFEDGIVDGIVGSTEVLDRQGDVISQDGWQLKNFKENPAVLWGHNLGVNRPPIGEAVKVWLDSGGKKAKKSSKRLMFKVRFDLQDSFAAEIFRKIKDGFIRTVSVGFKPLEWEALEGKEAGPFGGRRYLKQELFELSFVAVPANPEAVIELRQAGIDPVELKDLYAEREMGAEGDESEEEEADDTAEAEEEKPGKETEKDEGGEEDEKEDEKETSESEEGAEEGGEASEEEEGSEKEEEASAEEVETAEEPGKSEDESDEEDASEESEGAKGVVRFRAFETLPVSTSWDGPGEVRRAEVSDLRLMATWFDSADPDVKGSYKLPHHRASDKKVNWRGVAAAMAALLGARGGVDVPSGDRRGIYNHLRRHYAQFDREPPEFRMVQDQVLKGLDEEISALVLDREDKYTVRLIKKLTKLVKEDKGGGKKKPRPKKKPKPKKSIPNPTEIAQALEVIDQALSIVGKSRGKGV